jgi:hypothetical protein
MRPKLPLAFPLPATPWPVAYATKVKNFGTLQEVHARDNTVDDTITDIV